MHNSYYHFRVYVGIQEEENYGDISSRDLSVKRHLASACNIRERALSTSKKAAERMVKKHRSKHPPAEYDIGTQVLVRRFGTKSRKQAGKKCASKDSRVVQGTVIDRNKKNQTYHILYTLNGDEVEQWFKVSDITSLSHQEEKRKHLASQKVTASVSANTILSDPSSCQGNFKRDINETSSCLSILPHHGIYLQL